MPHGYRTHRSGPGGRILFAAMLVAAMIAIGLSVYVLLTDTVTPQRGSAGAVTANSPNRNPPSTVRSRPQR